MLIRVEDDVVNLEKTDLYIIFSNYPARGARIIFIGKSVRTFFM